MLSAQEQDWLRVRAHLREDRARLAGWFPQTVLVPPVWAPQAPVPLGQIRLEWQPVARPHLLPPTAVTEHLRPRRADGTRHASYSAAMGALCPPSVFVNRPTYRLRAGDLTAPQPWLAFEPGRYFDAIDTGEAVAHELAALDLGRSSGTPLRDWIGDPTDPDRRPINGAIACLTLRQEGGRASFPLHHRDPAKVGHAGGTAMVVPVGVFQAAGDAPVHQAHDFDLLRAMVREYAEELGGQAEREPGPDAATDYDAWPFARRFLTAVETGEITALVHGIAVDPLTLATDILVEVGIEADLYDELFTGPRDNAEGRIHDRRYDLDPATVAALLADLPMQAAGAHLLATVAAGRA